MTERREYEGFRGAGVRLTEKPLEHLEFHKSSLLGESVRGIHAFDKAHAVMLTECGIIPRETGRAILSALRRMEKVFGRVQSPWLPASGDETYEIIRRRLFQPLDADGEKARDETVKGFADM